MNIAEFKASQPAKADVPQRGMSGEREHIGLDGKPCQCTPAGRRRVTKGRLKTCYCHGVKHAKCPDAKPCIGGCGRMTTASETNACGYCPHCAADRRWVKVA